MTPEISVVQAAVDSLDVLGGGLARLRDMM